MIHVIPHHINKGSWPPWYELIKFNEPTNILQVDNLEDIERARLGEFPYIDLFHSHLSKLNLKHGDCVICDVRYVADYQNNEIVYNRLKDIHKKYGIKTFLVDDDNRFEFIDENEFTIFSNKFNTQWQDINFNYFRYRLRYHSWAHNIREILHPFLKNIRQKKANFIAGVDKKERLLILKHFYDSGLKNDSYIGYSGFNSNYSNDEISDKLIEFKKQHLPIILDTPYERSEQGSVNVEIPPIPITINSYVSCISETDVWPGHYVHLSEKSWNPFISLNIPLILGNPNTMEYLKNIGFWIAEDLFDLTPKTTLVDMINQYKSNLDIINKMSYSELHSYYENNVGSMENNYDIMMRQEFVFNRNSYK